MSYKKYISDKGKSFDCSNENCHAKDSIRKNNDYGKNKIIFKKKSPNELGEILINKEYFREKFEEIFKIRKKALTNGIDEREQQLMFDLLIDCFDEEVS